MRGRKNRPRDDATVTRDIIHQTIMKPKVPPHQLRRLALLCVVLAMIFGWWSRSPPAPRPADANPTEFSANRALAILTRILGDQSPHPTGTAANHAVRDRILIELRTIGVEPELRSRFVCGNFGTCATVENIIVRLRHHNSDATNDSGGVSRGSLLLASHYDSVPAGPGASDDGHAVAASIEIARILKDAPTRHRDVWILIGDGEEMGLLGAEAFSREPEYAGVERVINLEARGTTGNGELFETHDGNESVIDALKGVLPHPNASSINYEVYTRLPNNTDFSVFKRDGREGVNYAFIGGVARYHTPLDSLEYVDLRSVQDQGENALASIRAFDTRETWPRSSNQVFFDIWGRFLVGWSMRINTALVIITAALWLVIGWRLHREQKQGWRTYAAVFAMTLAPITAALGTFGLAMGLQAVGATPANWTANGPVLTAIAIATGVITTTWIAARLYGTASAFWVWGSNLPLLILTCVFVFLAPGMTQTTLLPCIVSCILLFAGPRWVWLAAMMGAVAATATLGPAILHLYTALGRMALPGVAALTVLLVLPVNGLLADEWRIRGFRIAALVILVALLVGSTFVPPFDASMPQQVSLTVVDGPSDVSVNIDTRGSQLNAIPANSFGLPLVERQRLPWVSAALRGAPAIGVLRSEQRPTADVTSGENDSVQIGITSNRNAQRVGLVLPAGIDDQSIRVNGTHFSQSVRGGHGTPFGWRVILVQVAAGERVRFDIEWPAGIAREGYVFDQAFQLPNEAQGWKAIRNQFGTPVHYGDTHMVWDRWTAGTNMQAR